MRPESHPFFGYRAISDEIFILEPSDTSTATSHRKSPDTILLFTWGDGHPKHVTKYADGYRKLYPSSRIIVVLCTLFGSMFQTVTKRTRAMKPVAEAAHQYSKLIHHNGQSSRVLIQIMSNSGTVSFIATLLAYRELYGMQQQPLGPFPCTLLVCDSSPGGTSFTANLTRWSRGLALAATAWIPFPPVVMQILWCIVLIFVECLTRIVCWPAIGRIFPGPIYDPELVPKKAPRLFLYSKDDELVGWEDVEKHVAQLRERGHTCTMERFEASPHVGHMRMYPETYWKDIDKAWKAAVAGV